MLFCSALAPPIHQRKSIQDNAIEIAIEDYLKCRLSKPYNAFLVWIDGISEYAPYKIDDDLIFIDISPAFYKVYITPVDTLGSTRVPTRHTIKNGKLFYWHDPDYGLTEEMVDIFHQFNVADSIRLEEIFTRQDERTDSYYQVKNHSKRGAHYYFCKNNPSNYKRVITNIATGWYKPPTIRCRQ